MNELNKMYGEIQTEEVRINKIAGSLDGAIRLLNIYSDHFKEKAIHVNDAIYEISRVNVIRKYKNQIGLI